MENLKHPHIAQHIVCPELEAQIKAAFDRNIQNGTDYTATRFRQALDSYVSSLISTPKGASALNSNLSDIKSHFCRGRKWVSIPTDNTHHQLAMDTAKSNNFDALVELFEKNNLIHARFHSATTHGINFSLHPDSSSASSVKFMVPTEDGMAFEVLDGTPKSCGLEGTPKKKTKKKKEVTVPVQVEEEIQALENDDSQNDEDQIVETQVIEDQVVEGPSEEELMSDETSMQDWEQMLAAEGIDLNFDEDNFDSFDEEVHA
tara:strand:- start:46 stop:825 length:780 start_codon:yes stop_codon:yes gene_type:complete